jgi:hypothetical protein
VAIISEGPAIEESRSGMGVAGNRGAGVKVVAKEEGALVNN